MFLYLFYFALATLLAWIFTPAVKKIAVRYKILDYPKSARKIHTLPTPMMGGLGVFSAFALALLVYLYFGHPNLSIVPIKFFNAILLGGLVLMLGGIIDDAKELPPKYLWIFPAIASIIVVWSGIGVGIKQLSNPFGQPIRLDFLLLGIPFSAIIMWFWMMGMIFTTKFLDGLDGLCSGITLIASLTLFALSLTSKINQPITASIAIILCGALFGYLFFAWNPASIFLGEGGSTFCGFMIGVLAIILGGKIATALIVMGIPILDIAWAITRRLWYKRSPFQADRLHLHHRLLDVGFTQKQTVLILYGICALFGFTAVFLQSFGKLIALACLFVVMVVLAISVVILYKRRHPHIKDGPENS